MIKADLHLHTTASDGVLTPEELVAKGQKANFDQILKEIQQRDYQDTHRPIAPLKMARDSVKVDTSELTIDEVVDAIRGIVAEKVGV